MAEKRTTLDDSLWQLTLTELGHLKTEFVWAHESLIANQMKSKRYQAPGQTATLILKGRLRVETQAGKETAGPGFWCLPHHGPRVVTTEAGSHILTVRFRISWPSGEPLFNAPVATIFPTEQAPNLLEQTRTLIQTVSKAMPGVKGELPWQKTDLLTHFHFQRAFGSWLYYYVETMLGLGAVPSRLAKIDPRTLQVIKRLDGMPLTEVIDEKDLFAECGLSPSQMTRLFVQYFTQTPHQYLENRRLNHAKMLIRSSSLAIKEVAFEVGFASLSAFSRWFKQKSGQSPRDFKHREQV